MNNVYRGYVQLSPDELKAQAQLENRKIQTVEPPAGSGPKNQGELYNEYKQGNKAQVSLF